MALPARVDLERKTEMIRREEGGELVARQCVRLAQELQTNGPTFTRSGVIALNDISPALQLSLLRLIKRRSLTELNDYVFLMTVLRRPTVNTWSPRSAAAVAANVNAQSLILLRHTDVLLDAYRWCYEQEPDGFYCPEIISLWSSLVHELGAAVCEPYLRPARDTALRAATDNGVGSIVAIILLLNLYGHEPELIEQLAPHLWQVEQALACAFSGGFFKERQWGPGPLSAALGVLTLHGTLCCSRPAFGTRLALQALTIARRTVEEWPTLGHGTNYFLLARVSACRIINNLHSHGLIEAAFGETMARGDLVKLEHRLQTLSLRPAQQDVVDRTLDIIKEYVSSFNNNLLTAADWGAAAAPLE